MPDLNSYEEVIQVSEDMQYPDGYNSIEIFGSGDSRQTRIFSTVSVTSLQPSIISDGVSIAGFKIDIFDPNSDNPFFLEPNTFESASIQNPQEMTVSNWIKNLWGVYLDSGKEVPIPMSFIVFSENKIAIKDGWQAVPGQGWDGLNLQEAWVEYDGQLTVSVEDGKQVVQKWWTRPGDDEDQTEKDVSGTMFIDSAGTVECTSSTVPIPVVLGKNATTYIYYRPDGGESGIAYMNAAYDNTPAQATLIVYEGAGQADIDIQLTPEPSGIGLGEESSLTVVATYTSGAPVRTGTGEFYIYKGGGSLTIVIDTFSSKAGEVETVYTSVNSATLLKTEFSLALPAISVQSITAVGGGWTWNGQVNISGSSCSLVGQEFPEDTIPIEVEYTWAGYALAKYKAGGTDAIGDTVYCGFRFGGHNALCEISIGTPSTVDRDSLSIDTEDSSLAFGKTTKVFLIAVAKDGAAGTGSVNLTTINGGTVTSPAVIGTKALTSRIGSINSLSTFTVDYPIASLSSIQNIRFLNTTYTAKSFYEQTITINESFGVTEGELTLDYTAKGYAEAVFTAPSTGDERKCYIVATWSDAAPQTAIVDVSATGDSGETLSISAEDTSLAYNQETTVMVSAIDADGNAGTGSVSFTAVNGGSVISPRTLGNKVLTDAVGSINSTKTFTVDYIPLSLPSIGPIHIEGIPGTTYTAQSFSGTTITINGTFPITSGNVILSYTGTGYAETTYTAPGVDATTYVVARWSEADPQTQAFNVDASGDGGNGSLSIDPDDSSLGYKGTTTIRIVAMNEDGTPGVGFVNLSNVNGSTPGSVVLGTKAFTDQPATVTGFSTYTVAHYIASLGSIGHMKFLGKDYPALSYEGNTVTISGTFPTVTGEGRVSYTTAGYAECTFTAPDHDATCYVTATWAEADPAACIIEVTAGGGAKGSIDIKADDTSLSYAATTTIRISALDAEGNPGTGVVYLDNIEGSTPSSVVLGTKALTNQKAGVNGPRTCTVEYPTTLASIGTITFLGSSHTATAVTNGTTITVNPPFRTVTGNATLNYTARGYAECQFTAPSKTIECYVTATWKDADPKACIITVSEGGNGDSVIALTADPDTVAFGAESTINCTTKNSDGTNGGVATYNISPADTGVFTRPSGTNGDYTGKWKAPNFVTEVTITAIYKDPLTNVDHSAKVKIKSIKGDEPPPEGVIELTATAEPTSIVLGETAKILATLTTDGAPRPGALITARLMGTYQEGNASGGITGYDGVANGSYSTSIDDKTGTAEIECKYVGQVIKIANISITVGDPPEGETYDIPIEITGKVNPGKNIVEDMPKDATILSWGAAKDADEFWCVEANPQTTGPSSKILVHVALAPYVPSGDKIKNIVCEGWTPPEDWKNAEGEIDYTYGMYGIDVPVSWEQEANTSLISKIYVGDKADPTIPVIGAKVTLQGKTVDTDGKGFATFKSLAAGSWPILIEHDNYSKNTEDSDDTNDIFVVKPFSTRPYRLNETSINFTITLTNQMPYVPPK